MHGLQGAELESGYCDTANCPLAPPLATHVPERRDAVAGAVNVTMNPAHSVPRAVNCPAETPHSPASRQ